MRTLVAWVFLFFISDVSLGKSESINLKAFPKLKGFEFASPADFIDEIEKKDRRAQVSADINGDKIQDEIAILVSKKEKTAGAFLFLGKKGGSFDKPIELKVTPLEGKNADKVDLSVEIKGHGEAGISGRKYFSSEDSKSKNRYAGAISVEVTYQEYYCTKGFYFHQKKLISEEACD